MKRILPAVILSGFAALAQAADTIAVYKDANCGCCGKWVEHMRAAGFDPKVVETPKMNSIKAQFGVPMELRSCHTSVIGGYVIEGHVPAGDVRRLLAQRPKVKGLAAPGMPAGSPGMDVPNAPAYDVVAFTAQGQASLFARH